MTFSWIFRMVFVWLWLLVHGGNMATCERVWDMSPGSHAPPGVTFEEWYGSPELMCNELGSSGDHHKILVYCWGPNC